MIIRSLSVTDFRVFQGRTTFDLAPRTKWNAARPIVLFGGLNGAGKTSILSAIRLALYGRQALGRSVSAKQYDEYLLSSIHKSKDRVLQANQASVEMDFRYTHMGVDNLYTVKRVWFTEGKKLTEKLEITRDGELLEKLSDEQKQGFLNELIPIGLSDLFFFDGEKIAELALDESGAALADSIKKLLGLDVIERLEGDLSVIVREHERSVAQKSSNQAIEALEHEFNTLMERADDAEQTFDTLEPAWQEAKALLAVQQRDFLARGGAFANTRAEEEQRLRELMKQRDTLQDEMRSLLAGAVPIALAPAAVDATLQQIALEETSQRAQLVAKDRAEFVSELNNSLQERLSSEQFEPVEHLIKQTLERTTLPTDKVSTIHCLGAKTFGRIEATIDEAKRGKERLDDLAVELSSVNEEIDKVGLQIARAPDDAALQSAVDSLEALREKVNEVSAKRELHRETARESLRLARDIARQLDEVQGNLNAESRQLEEVELAKSAQQVLLEFSKRAAREKTAVLARQFERSFQRLARKDDMSVSAAIDPTTFKVSLTNGERRHIEKDELSAGEKQIYAIAMLEALAKTSGRKLPIIIDTPLGRLDSKHRDKLVNNYFPTASHQVVILSTDTEVDEQFYRDLNKHISHSYKLEYESASGHTTATESYFWKSNVKDQAA